MSWFSVDRQGLAAILERRGKVFAVFELLANAWDSGSQEVKLTLTPRDEEYALLGVEDWGEGFDNLDDANTLFARSRRAGDAEKRGRFNLGEKLVLACCRSARIQTTVGSVEFLEDGNVRRRDKRRSYGTVFEADIRMTADEYRDVCQAMRRVIPPVTTVFNSV